jgi:hypothetical protein
VIEKYCAKQRSRTYGEGSIRSVGGYMIETRRSQEITYISAQREEAKKNTRVNQGPYSEASIYYKLICTKLG